jgi:hypothetical protein
VRSYFGVCFYRAMRVIDRGFRQQQRNIEMRVLRQSTAVANPASLMGEQSASFDGSNPGVPTSSI